MSDAGVLAGRVVVVTGGSTGIGYACAEAAVAAGARVLIAARTAAQLDAAGRQLGAPDRVAAVVGDVAREDDVVAMFDAAERTFGAVDGIVHAAAVIGPIGPVTQVAAAEWLDAVRVDLFGAFLVAREAARRMSRRGRGSIVLLSGGGGTSPFPHYTAYACSKAGVVRLAESLALELEPAGVRVNALAPGFVATRMHAATLAAGARAGEAYVQRTREQLAAGGVPASAAAAAAVFLLGEASSGISGRLLAVPWDDWRSWPERAQQIAASDLFTVRRIVPADRGLAW